MGCHTDRPTPTMTFRNYEPRARVRHSGWPSGPETVAPCLDRTADRIPLARIEKP